MQAKLLRVLQEREVTRVGTSKPVKVDVRVIAATHQDLEAMVESGRFRADLYFRLKVFQIRVPDLRERPGDIPALVAAAVARWNEGSNDPSRRVPGCSEETVELLRSYDWPGNVRELMGAVEHACIVSGGKRLLPRHLPPEILEAERSEEAPNETGSSESGRRYQAPDPAEERETIRVALDEAQGNRTQAAAALGMGRTTLWQKLKAYGLD
jgi:DNA-binding NtrC family response regulator